MKVVFRDSRLARVRTSQAGDLGLPNEVIKSCQHKLLIVDAAPDERTLRNWKSLRYEKLVGTQRGKRSIRLNDQWRIVFVLDESTSPPTIEITSIEDYHK